MKYLLIAVLFLVPACGMLEAIGSSPDPASAVPSVVNPVELVLPPEVTAAMQQAADSGDEGPLLKVLQGYQLPAWLVGAIAVLFAVPRSRQHLLTALTSMLKIAGLAHSTPESKAAAEGK